MTIDIVNYIKNKILDSDPDADVRPGSALNDLLISPLASILDPFVKTQENLIDFLTLIDPETMSEMEMDHLASNFFIERLSGSKVTGNVRIYYDRPVNLDIPQNTKFTTSSGKAYYAKAGYSINRADMASKIEGSQYHSGDILVEAENSGTEYEISGNEISQVDGISVVPNRVRNPRAFVGGSTKEST